MKDTLLLYTSYSDKFQKLTDAQFGQLIRIILKYQMDGIDPIIEDAAVSLAFDVIRYDIDINTQKYNEKIEKKREAGAKGGKQKVANAKNDKQSVAKVADAKNAKQKVANQADNEHVHDNVHDNDYISASSADIYTDDAVADVVSAYNSLCPDFAKAAIPKDITKRYKFVDSIRAVSLCFSLPEVTSSFERAARSDFLKTREWKVTLEWILDHIDEINSGKYDNTHLQDSNNENRNLLSEIEEISRRAT